MNWTEEFFEKDIADIFSSKSITSRKIKMLIISEKRQAPEIVKMSSAERSRILINGTFTLLACFAKADFFISKREATLLNYLIKGELAMNSETARHAVQVFNQIQSVMDLEPHAEKQIDDLARAWGHDTGEIQRIFNMCLAMSLCHGKISYLADKWLMKIIKQFNLHPINYMPVREQFLHPHAEAYHTLQIATMVDQDQIKLAWRRQCALYHPDKLVKASSEKQAWAKEKLHQINQAYELLRQSKSSS
jgi:DnaJ-domain-containing protein 1